MPHLKSPKNQNRRAALGRPAIKITGGLQLVCGRPLKVCLIFAFMERKKLFPELSSPIKPLAFLNLRTTSNNKLICLFAAAYFTWSSCQGHCAKSFSLSKKIPKNLDLDLQDGSKFLGIVLEEEKNPILFQNFI